MTSIQFKRPKKGRMYKHAKYQYKSDMHIILESHQLSTITSEQMVIVTDRIV
jgi:hypothetical protein